MTEYEYVTGNDVAGSDCGVILGSTAAFLEGMWRSMKTVDVPARGHLNTSYEIYRTSQSDPPLTRSTFGSGSMDHDSQQSVVMPIVGQVYISPASCLPTKSEIMPSAGPWHGESLAR
jgi:hypothetical protein